MPGIGVRGGSKQWLFSDTESAQAQNNGQQVIKVCPQSAGSIVAPTCNVRREEETMVYAGLAATTRLSLMGLSALTTVPSVMLHFPSEPPSRFRLHRKCTWDHVRATKSPVRYSKAIFLRQGEADEGRTGSHLCDATFWILGHEKVMNLRYSLFEHYPQYFFDIATFAPPGDAGEGVGC